MNCIRCGQNGTQYGTDGMSYCDSCLFYGMNKQCNKCGMYLPSLELQMYNGQWYCPYCVMDLRDANKPKYDKKENYAVETIKYESCERCGRQLKDYLYVYKGRKLCHPCVEEEKDKDPGPIAPPPMRVSLERRFSENSSPLMGAAGILAEGLFGWILRILRLKKKKKQSEEIVALIKEEEDQIKKSPEKKKEEKLLEENLDKTESKENKETKEKEKISKEEKNKNKEKEENKGEKEKKDEESKTDWNEHKQD